MEYDKEVSIIKPIDKDLMFERSINIKYLFQANTSSNCQRH